MTFDQFYDKLNYVNASRENRLKYANMVLNDMDLFPKLVEILFMVNDKVSCHASWVFEFVCIENIYTIVPHLDTFSKNIKHIKFDSAIRPVSKICSLIAAEATSKTLNPIKTLITPKQKEHIVEICFDWMISDQKVAVKVHAMETLFLLGKDSSWVHPELIQILEQDFLSQSAGYKSRAKRILKRIKKA